MKQCNILYKNASKFNRKGNKLSRAYFQKAFMAPSPWNPCLLGQNQNIWDNKRRTSICPLVKIQKTTNFLGQSLSFPPPPPCLPTRLTVYCLVVELTADCLTLVSFEFFAECMVLKEYVQRKWRTACVALKGTVVTMNNEEAWTLISFVWVQMDHASMQWTEWLRPLWKLKNCKLRM